MKNNDELTIHVMHGYDTIESPTGEKCFGCYVQGQNEIYIADGISMDQFFFTLAHEFAHFLQDADGREFDEEEADAFAMSVTKAEDAQIVETITEYLMNNKDYVVAMFMDDDKEMLQDEILEELSMI